MRRFSAMTSREDVEATLKSHLPVLRERFNVERIGMYGSWARGDQTEDSDLDMLVSLSEPLGLRIVDLHEYLEKLLGAKADLVTEGAVIRKPLLWQAIGEDLVYV
jgi:predicted nucleotidyltransferase